MRLYRLALFLMIAASSAALAGVPADQSAPPPAESRKQAYSACGGPPIQAGRDIQPTPAHDKCLAQKQHIRRPSRPATPPQTGGTPPVMPAAELPPDPQPHP